jgi:hypothetical protein
MTTNYCEGELPMKSRVSKLQLTSSLIVICMSISHWSNAAEEFGNSLSFPAIFTDAVFPLPGIFGAPEFAGNYLLWDGESDSTPCDPTVSPMCDPAAYDYRVYLQKGASTWQAESTVSSANVAALSHVDVGDNLQSVPWRTTSVVRIEFVPFVDLLLQEGREFVAYHMVYVSGLGVNEVWGTATTNPEDANAIPEPYPGGGQPTTSAYGTAYSGDCMVLSLTKLEADRGDPDVAPASDDYSWDADFQVWRQANADPIAQSEQLPISAEINVKGRLIYGHNWFLRNQEMHNGVSKAGWWRLTFFSDNNACPQGSPFDYTNTVEGNPTANGETEEPDESDDNGGGTGGQGGGGNLPDSYPRSAVIDSDNSLVYIDIYLRVSPSGGQGRGGDDEEEDEEDDDDEGGQGTGGGRD